MVALIEKYEPKNYFPMLEIASGKGTGIGLIISLKKLNFKNIFVSGTKHY
jgi:hypothetical protein